MSAPTRKQTRSVLEVRVGDIAKTQLRKELYDDVIDRALNWAYLKLRAVNVVGHWYVKIGHTNGAQGVYYYAFPSDCSELIDAYLKYSTATGFSAEEAYVAVTPCSFSGWRVGAAGDNSLFVPSESSPSAATIVESVESVNTRRLYVDPAPAAAYTDFIRWLYWRQPDAPAENTALDIPEEHHGIVQDYATAKILRFFPEHKATAEEMETAVNREVEALMSQYGPSPYLDAAKRWRDSMGAV